MLMSCYNARRWLREAIESVLTQTFRNFEFLIVDDGSTDDTWAIIREYAGKDSRIVPIQKPNTGLADSLNVGIAHARADWIARLDADDLCEANRLAEQLRFVRQNPEVVLLGSGFTEIDEDGRVIKKHAYPCSHKALVRHLERLMRFFPHSSALYRTAVVRKVGGYNGRIKRSEDSRLWLELADIGKLSCLPLALVRVRKHGGQVSLDDFGKRQLFDATAACVCQFLQRMGRRDPSKSEVAGDWQRFLAWIEDRVEKDGMVARSTAWAVARTAYFSASSRPMGIVKCGLELLRSGLWLRLIWEKFAGTGLPRRLAEDWARSRDVGA